MKKLAHWLRLENCDLLERWIRAEESGQISGGGEQLTLDLGQANQEDTAGADRSAAAEMESRISELEKRIAKLEAAATNPAPAAEVEAGREQSEADPEPEPEPADGGPHEPEEKTEITAYICQLAAEGLSSRKIAERLTAEGRPTLSGGGKWHFSVVARLLKKAQK
jgi:hypothetical protein